MRSISKLILILGMVGLLPHTVSMMDGLLSQGETPELRQLTFSDLLQASRHGDELNADRRVLHKVLEEKRKIIEELIDGGTSLAAAASDLRAADEKKPPHMRIHQNRLPDESAEEYFIHLALELVNVTLRDDSRREAVLIRLEAELEEHKRLLLEGQR